MFGVGKPSAKGLIGKLRDRGLTLDQIAALLPPDAQERPVSRVTLSKVLGGEYSGAQLIERLRDLVDGKPSKPAPLARSTSLSPRRRGETRQSAGPHTPKLARSTHAPATTSVAPSPATAIPLPDDAPPAEIGAPVYFDKDRIGYVGPGGAIVKERPQPPAPHSQSRTSPRRQLLKQYTDLRAGGQDDTSAQAQLTQLRSQQHRQAQIDHHEREIRRLAPQFVAAARRHLAGAGSYVEADVMPLARHMAARSVVLEQPARQGDVVRQLPPPRLPALPPAQPALPIWQGARRPASFSRVALGGERRVLPEEARAAIHEAVASLARRQGIR